MPETKFKVIALTVGTDTNKVFHSGEIVSSKEWANPATAVAEKFIEPYAGEELAIEYSLRNTVFALGVKY